MSNERTVNAMTCSNCGASLQAGRIDTSLGVVTCSHCGSLFDLPDAPGRQTPARKPERREVALPSRFDITRRDGGMEVAWPVGRPMQGVILLIFTGIFAYLAVTTGFLVLLLGCLWLVYFAAVRVFNRRRLRVDGARLEFTQGPLPWPGNRKLDASELEQVHVSEHQSRTQTGSSSNRQIDIRTYYRLSATTRSGKRVTLLSGLGDAGQALWLEQEIERVLGIRDQSVAGAYVQ